MQRKITLSSVFEMGGTVCRLGNRKYLEPDRPDRLVSRGNVPTHLEIWSGGKLWAHYPYPKIDNEIHVINSIIVNENKFAGFYGLGPI